MKKRLFIIDGHAQCYRAYYAFINNPLRNSKGQNTSAIFGFARMLLKLINEQKPDYLMVAFDPPNKTFRFKLFPEYKAKRQKMPEDLRPQIEEIKRMLSVMGITKIEHQDYEADDVLGTVAAMYGSGDTEVMLVTGDKDAYQLVNSNVKIYAGKKGITEFEIYDREKVIQKTGLAPEQIVDYMALMGDTSDNVPGVPGIGEKTAQKLIAQYGNLDNVYSHVDEIKGAKAKEAMKDSKDLAYLSKDLVTIRKDVPIAVDLKKAVLPELKSAGVRDYFKDMEMDSIVQELFPEGMQKSDSGKEDNKKYRIITNKEEMKAALKEIYAAGEISVDTETTSVNPLEAELVGISISVREKEGWYIPVLSRGLFSDGNIDVHSLLEQVKPVLEDGSIKKIGQNIKYDILVLKVSGIELRGVFFDTMVAAYILDPESRVNMDALAEKHLNYKTIHFEDIIGKDKNATAADVPLEKISEYAIEDADITYRLYKLFKEKLKAEDMEKLFYDIEMPLVLVLAEMEWSGVKIDTGRFTALNNENRKMLDEVESRIYAIAGRRFNINSTRELASVLFEKLKLKPVRKTKTGFSTDIRVLEELKGRHEIIEHLISYRTLAKLKNTYIEKLPRIISPRTGRIHTSYNQTVTATGRLSSSNPNLQNIPVRDEFGRKIRSAFIPDRGKILISADYSQIELRLAAHFSADENMVNAFKNGIDIHNLTASSVFNVPMDSITPDMRRQAKIINFATIYGVSPFGLSQQADIDIHQAAEFIKKYFETYPGFRDYINTTISSAKESGFVKTLLGRKRYLPDLNSEAVFRREGAERIAINTPLQGTAADMIKIAMIKIQNVILKKGYKTKMILQVHDELVFEAPESEKETMMKLIKKEMEDAVELIVPVIVDIAAGKNWDEAH